MSKRTHSHAAGSSECGGAFPSDPTRGDASVWKLNRTLTCQGIGSAKHDSKGQLKPEWDHPPIDYVNGPATSQARLRLFGKSEDDVRVVLYRDHHGWCPYCEKVWLWLEEKRVPYRVNKVTMFCYGQKEAWFTRHVNRRGMIPAITLDGNIVMESDDIIHTLETEFGPIRGKNSWDDDVVEHRILERRMFGTWCDWLCQPNNPDDERKAQEAFIAEARKLGDMLRVNKGGPYLMGAEPIVSDIVFVPFLERMAASLFYFKGYELKHEVPNIGRFLDGWQRRDQTYRGMMSDYHTHVHALPPQMGGCYFTPSFSWTNKPTCARLVDNGPYELLADISIDDWPYDPAAAALEAAEKVERHWEIIAAVNAYTRGNGNDFDVCMRYAITHMLITHGLLSRFELNESNSTEFEGFPPNAELILRYARDRICCPRDMTPWAAKTLKAAMEEVAQSISDREPAPPPTEHRLDQDPYIFTSHIPPVSLPKLYGSSMASFSGSDSAPTMDVEPGHAGQDHKAPPSTVVDEPGSPKRFDGN